MADSCRCLSFHFRQRDTRCRGSRAAAGHVSHGDNCIRGAGSSLYCNSRTSDQPFVCVYGVQSFLMSRVDRASCRNGRCELGLPTLIFRISWSLTLNIDHTIRAFGLHSVWCFLGLASSTSAFQCEFRCGASFSVLPFLPVFRCATTIFEVGCACGDVFSGWVWLRLPRPRMVDIRIRRVRLKVML